MKSAGGDGRNRSSLCAEIQINIYRIFQESLTMWSDMPASLVLVNVARQEGKVSFTVRDDGRGLM